MRSKASIDGHPLHPALIPFPFAFLSGGLVFDLAGRLLNQESWWVTGYHLTVAGLLTGVVAAIPGLIDYAYTVPPRSSGKTRATRHMVLILTAVAAFTVAVWLRGSGTPVPTASVLAIEMIGFACLMAGGSLGGTLVTRDQISVDHRLAAGRELREAFATPDEDGTIIGATSTELGIDQMKLLHAPGKRVVLARTVSGYVAFDDACTHEGGSLAAGTMICGTVQCPWHGSQFDTRTGCARTGPAERGVALYHVEEVDGQVRIRL
jgi:uncharacterized membrane protein/nitrite reductase/ring-hydroxylating ferredoxin subunit